jgi:hypothetical protein
MYCILNTSYFQLFFILDSAIAFLRRQHFVECLKLDLLSERDAGVLLSKCAEYPFKLSKLNVEIWDSNSGDYLDSVLKKFLTHYAPDLKHLKLLFYDDVYTSSLDFVFRKMKLESLCVNALPDDLRRFSDVPLNQLRKLEVGRMAASQQKVETLVRIYNNIQELAFFKDKHEDEDCIVEDATVRMLVQNLPRLKRLKLATMSLATVIESSSLEEISIGSVHHSFSINAPNLKSLNISDHLDQHALCTIFCRAPNLECVNVKTHCSISKELLDSVKKYCPKLHTLAVYEGSLDKDVNEEKIRIHLTEKDELRCRIELAFA